MALEFRDVTLAPIEAFRAMAPAGVIIGVIGDKGSGATELLKLAGGAVQPTQGQVIADPQRRYVALGETLNLAPAAVLALDQALATQDALVRVRTLTGLDRLRRNGSTILLSSHEYGLLETLCDEVWWMHEGQLAAKGDPKETLQKYRRHVAEAIRAWGETIPSRIAPSFRRGNGHAEVIGLDTLGAGGAHTIVWKSGEMATVRATVRFHETVTEPVLGLLIRTQIGFEVYGTNTELEGVKIGPCQAGETVAVNFSFLCDLCPGAYTLTVASHDPDGTAHDWLDDAVAVTVTDERSTAGVANLHAKVTAEKQVAAADSLK
jgi:ABC-type nitrate/sulfonate/bicarbonate transport system ATPase subunit